MKKKAARSKEDVLLSMRSRIASAKTAIRKSLAHLDQADGLLQSNITGSDLGLLSGDEEENIESLDLLRELRMASEQIKSLVNARSKNMAKSAEEIFKDAQAHQPDAILCVKEALSLYEAEKAKTDLLIRFIEFYSKEGMDTFGFMMEARALLKKVRKS